MKPRTLLLVISLIFTSSCLSDTADEPQLEQLAWLTGCWKGTGLGGEVEECWLQSSDKRFTGVFQMMEDGQQQFSEIVMIAEFDGRFGMRVKHFDPGFNQWESDKGVGHTFAFVEMGQHFIQFEGLRYELIDGVCHVTLDMKNGDEIHQVSFILARDQGD
jgi:hypothetical protein